jgi:hypothetical protein
MHPLKPRCESCHIKNQYRMRTLDEKQMEEELLLKNFTYTVISICAYYLSLAKRHLLFGIGIQSQV